MAYFSNGTDGDCYDKKYCSRCVHNQGKCPILFLHLDWNYEAVGKDADPAKAAALDTLWPRNDDGTNGECAMFIEREVES